MKGRGKHIRRKQLSNATSHYQMVDFANVYGCLIMMIFPGSETFFDNDLVFKVILES